MKARRGPRKDSKRRWKARCRNRQGIPRDAIEEFELTRWFTFEQVDLFREYYVATPKGAKP